MLFRYKNPPSMSQDIRYISTPHTLFSDFGLKSLSKIFSDSFEKSQFFVITVLSLS